MAERGREGFFQCRDFTTLRKASILEGSDDRRDVSGIDFRA